MLQVSDFELYPTQLGADKHLLWLRPYVQYVEATVDWLDILSGANERSAIDYELVPAFLETPQGQLYKEHVHWHIDETWVL